MPDFMDDLLQGDLGEPGADDGDPEKDPSPSPKEPKSTDKRVSDLQSARDKETARANKAEAKLAALLSVANSDSDSSSRSDPISGNADGVILEMARMFTVQQNPKLAEYGLSEQDLTGTTPGEIARSASALIARFEKIETQVRNKVLADNGLAPELDGTAVPTPDRDFSKMSSEDFKKLMDAAMQGRV